MNEKCMVLNPAKCRDSQVGFEESTGPMITCSKFSSYAIWFDSTHKLLSSAVARLCQTGRLLGVSHLTELLV